MTQRNTKIGLEVLLSRIREAFPDVPCPDDKHILIEGVAESEYHGNETAGLSGVRWFDFPKRCYHEATNSYAWPWLFDLTPSAFHYYLPGYMMICAQFYHQCPVDDVVAMLVLNNPNSFKDTAFRRERFELFTLKQKQTVRQFLEYLIQEYSDDIQYSASGERSGDALEQYWGDF